MRRRKNKIIAGTVVAVMMAGSIIANISPLIASQTGGNSVAASETFNKEGLWITEIYQNDVDRSEKNNTREKSGYESIKLYKSTTDLMEFVEITSTYDKAVNFNDIYEFVYNDTVQKVTTMDGNDEVIIQPEEKVVLWNYRSDVTTAIPTEEEFRRQMRIPDDAVVLKVTSGVNWAVTSTFSLKTKSDDGIISTFKATDKADTMDGYSVELAIPDIGNEMQVYREMCEPSPGYVYSGQLNGLVNAKVPDNQIADGVFITEVRPNDINRSSVYGISDDLMECVEVVNTTDHDVDLNNEYQFGYAVKEGSRKILQLSHYDENAESNIGSSEGCVVPAGKTAVLWYYRINYLKNYTSFPTEKEFRAAYNISDDIPVYLCTDQNGMNNTNRVVELYKLDSDGTRKMVSYYSYIGSSDCKDNKSAELMVNPEGPEMLLKTGNAATSMGVVSADQYTYLKDDGSALTLRLNDVVPESIMQGDELRVNFYFAENGSLPRTGTIIVQCTADSALPELDTVTDGKLDNNADWDGTTVPKDYDFCFAWETDTQYYAEEWQNHFLNINNWIVNNAEERKIKYVIHTGDIVDDVDMTYEWENADEAMGILDKAGMSYGVLGGNHDVAAGLADYENYYKYFGENRFKSQNTYGESYKNNKGHYDLISEGGQDFIIVYMSWNIYQEEIDWMNQVLQQYSDRKAILCFHTYTNVKQSSGTYLDYYGQLVQKNVVAKNPNVFAVLNGHYHGSSYETVMFDDDGDGKNDRTVYQICTDYQSGFEGGNEYIKFLYFDLDNNKIYMNSYSPCMDDFNYYDTDVHTLNVEGASATGVDEMVLDVEFNTNEQTILEKSFNAYVYTNEEIGTANVDSSTGKAVLQVNNLEANTGYKWYAVVTNAATGVKRSGVYEFTTAKKNTDVITDDSQDTSDKSGNIIATGDNARIWVYILVGMSAIAVGIVSVKKKKEA